MREAVEIVFGIMSMISLILYGVDKLNAENGGSRIPEVILIIVSAFGGVCGTILGMVFFNHKSNMSHKWHFLCTLLASFLVQLTILLMALDIIKV